MKKMLLLSFCFVILNITGCDKKKNEAEVKPLEKQSVVIKYDNAMAECQKSTDEVGNMAVYLCANGQVEAAEEEMNGVLAKIYITLKDQENIVEALKEYQSAWEIYSKAEADFDATNIGTPQREITLYINIAKRIDYLNDFLKEIELNK